MLNLNKTYLLLNPIDVENFVIKRIPGGIESLYFPKIYNLSEGGIIKKKNKDILIFQFSNASYYLNSDFIRFEDKTVFCDKFARLEMEFMLCGDADFLKYSNGMCTLKCGKQSIHFDIVFHLTGCFSSVWAHFLVQYFSKLEFIKLIPSEEKAAIALPSNIDRHILFLIEHYISDFKNVEIFFCETAIEIKAKKMYYVSLDSWLGDVGKAATLFHIQVSDFTSNFVLNRSQSLINSIRECKKLKLFIGRRGQRNISNYSEVCGYFRLLGFIEIFPHELSFTEKINLFSSANFIAGPLSSGFSNIIFCDQQPNVLALTNPSRHDDMYLTKFAKNLNINLQIFLGREEQPGNSDSHFYIDLHDLKQCMDLF